MTCCPRARDASSGSAPSGTPSSSACETDAPVPFYELFDEPASLAEREAIAGFLNLCFARSVLEETLDRKLRTSCSITLAQHEVLYRLSLAPGGRLRMAELATMLLASKSGASRLVDRMAAAGLLERGSSDVDRRLVFAVLTDAGRQALVRSGPVFRSGVLAAFGVHLDDQEHRALRGILKKLLAAHNAWDERRCEPPADTADTAEHSARREEG
jgi:DNA-binding MarR family transcriptional regulator